MSIFLVVLCLTSSVFAQENDPQPNRFSSALLGEPLVGIDLPGVVVSPGVWVPSTQTRQVCPEFGIFLVPDPTSCNRFILCNNGIATPHKCSEGSHFSIETGICIEREVANCDLCQFNREPERFLPFEGSCTRYTQCFGTNGVERECPNGFHFNASTNQCDRRENVECTERNIDVPRVSCPNSPGVEQIPSLTSCAEYFICANGSPSSHSCSDGFIFDIDTNNCAPTGRCLLDYAPLCGFDISFEPHPYHCQHYFFCTNGRPILRSCAPGLLFDTAIGQCNIDTVATCARRPNDDPIIFPNFFN